MSLVVAVFAVAGIAAAAVATTAVAARPAAAAGITGAGASFPFPIYAKWADAYRKQTGNVVNFQSIGSGGGIAQIFAHTVDFGATDAPLSPEELRTAGLVQFPLVIGGVVPVVNFPRDAGAIRLTGPLLADIFLGRIKAWNDPAIAAVNQGLRLPPESISIVRRSDASGTTFLWTDYLSKVSPEWKARVGAGMTVAWPDGIGAKGNEGVAAYVQKIRGAIGYVEFAYAMRTRLVYAAMQNRAGEFVQPSGRAFLAAAEAAAWSQAPGLGVVLTDQPGKASWPVTGASYIVMPVRQDASAGREALQFFSWVLRNGGRMAEDLEFVPLPAAIAAQVEALWRTQLKDAAGQPLSK